MIFYFTGTGNSLYIAKKIADKTSDSLISIADMIEKDEYTFTLNEYEKIGFVFPVYWWGMPTIVEEFIEKISFINYSNNYTYAIGNMGKTSGNTMTCFRRKMNKKDININSLFTIVMPDNYILMYNGPTKPEIKRIIEKADIKIEDISSKINKNFDCFIVLGGLITPFSSLFHNYYKMHRSTKKYQVENTCNGCGFCANNCPSKAIVMENNHPVWIKDCTGCLSCVNRCPQKSIFLNKKMKTRRRYVNKEAFKKENDCL